MTKEQILSDLATVNLDETICEEIYTQCLLNQINEDDITKALDQEKRTYYEKWKSESAHRAYRNKYTAAASIEAFKKGIKDSANIPAISTGFKELDKILDGGLYEGLYCLGAISSLGKTTLILQIADNLAKQGKDVLIFSLEMAKTELMAKSISRLTYQNANGHPEYAKTMRGITTGSRYVNYSEGEKNLIANSIEEYQTYANRIFIHEGIGDIGINQIRSIIENHIEVTKNRPIVFIDYLQILAPYDMRATDKQNIDKAITELKRMSRDYKIPVIGVSSFNRESYKSGGTNLGKVSQSDFKESGAIEYSADVLIGLEFAAAGETGYTESAEKRKNPRRIRLVVLKNRNGRAWENTEFDYYPLFNYFEESDGFTPASEADENIFKDLKAI